MEISKELSVIFGPLIGGWILTTWIQQKSQENRDLNRIAFEMAVKEYEIFVEISKTKANAIISPLETFVTYYIEYLKIVKSKKVQNRKFKSVAEFQNGIQWFFL